MVPGVLMSFFYDKVGVLQEVCGRTNLSKQITVVGKVDGTENGFGICRLY